MTLVDGQDKEYAYAVPAPSLLLNLKHFCLIQHPPALASTLGFSPHRFSFQGQR